MLRNIGELDFSNPEKVNCFGSLFLNNANLLGWCIGSPIAPADRSGMLKIAKTFVKELDAAFKNSSAAYALSVYSSYNWAYRIAYNTPPAPDFTFGIVRVALDARIHGDKDIDIYELYRLIDLGMMFYPELYKDKAQTWRNHMLESWHEEFQSGRDLGPKCLTASSVRRSVIADRDILNRVAILIESDLRTFEQNQKSFKKRLFDNHRHYIDDLLNGNADYDTNTLMALMNFIRVSFNPFISQEEHDAYTDAALIKLHEKTNSPYLKASIEVRREADKRFAEERTCGAK